MRPGEACQARERNVAGVYYDYATGSNAKPTPVPGGTAPNTVVYNQYWTTKSPADIDNAGGLSPWGTMAQSGNVHEWSESAFTPPNDSPSEGRVVRGGFWSSTTGDSLQPSYRNSSYPAGGSRTIGFRVAAVPEPSAIFLVAAGALGFFLGRKRG